MISIKAKIFGALHTVPHKNIFQGRWSNRTQSLICTRIFGLEIYVKYMYIEQEHSRKKQNK